MLKWLFTLICLCALPSGLAPKTSLKTQTTFRGPVKLCFPPSPGPVYIHCGALFDGKSNQLDPNVLKKRRGSISGNGTAIVDVSSRARRVMAGVNRKHSDLLAFCSGCSNGSKRRYDGGTKTSDPAKKLPVSRKLIWWS
jgi:hypothetical protein